MPDADDFLVEAQREVDALTPSVPAIAPLRAPAPPIAPSPSPAPANALEPLEGWPRGRFRSGQTPRPPGARFHNATQEFVLPDGFRVPWTDVANIGWARVLQRKYTAEEIARMYGWR